MAMPFERVYSPAVETSNALAVANDPECTADLMVGFYADCLVADWYYDLHPDIPGVMRRCDYLAINRAILARWSLRTLTRIKIRAWPKADAICKELSRAHG
jgi:hypothetical protein